MSRYEDDQSFGRLAVRMGFCNRRQLEDALARQRGLELEDNFDHLGTILARDGILTRDQVDRILDMQRELSGTERVAGFEILAEIGRGAAGVVYKARQLALDRFVALKLMPRSAATSREYKARFMREARIAASLSHPNIIKAIDAGESPEAFYLAMELFEAPDLLKILRKRGPLPESETVSIGIQVAKALEHARENNLVHRDVKPENLLMRESDGLVKLTDLGLARSTSSEAKSLTREGSTLGTPYYKSPEAVKGLTAIDIRADIYSLGATLYHLAVGRPPFEAETAFLVQRMHLETPLVPPVQARQGLSEGFSRVVSKALRKDPAKRYQTPSEMLADLEDLAAGRHVEAERSARSSVRRRPAGRRSPAAIAAVVVAIAAAAGGAAFFTFGGARVPAAPGPSETSREKPRERPAKTDKAETRRVPPDETRAAAAADPGAKAFAEASDFAKKNPDAPERIVADYEDVAERFPSMAARCRVEIERWRPKTLEARLDALVAEVNGLETEKKFGPAIRLLDAFGLSNVLPDDVASLLSRRSAEIATRAQSEARIREARARTLASKGRFDEALASAESLREMDVPTVSLKADLLVREFRAARTRAQRVSAHISLLDAVQANGLASAAAAARKGEFPAEDGPVFESALALLERAVKAVRDRTGNMIEIRKRDGDDFPVKVASATDLKIVGADPSGAPVELPWTAASIEAVASLAGTDARSARAVCFAWCVHRDADAVFPGGGLRAAPESMALADLAADCESSIAEARLARAEDFIEAARPGAAAEILRGLLAEYGGLEPFSPFEGRVRAAFERALGGGIASFAPFLFSGRSSASNETLDAVWDFSRARHMEDFSFRGRFSAAVNSGRLVQSDPDPVEASARFPGSWPQAKVSLRAHIPESGGLGLQLAPPSGPPVALFVSVSAGMASLHFARLGGDGEWTPFGRRKKVKAPADGAFMETVVAGEMASVSFNGASAVWEKVPAGPYALSLLFTGRCEIKEIGVSGKPDPAWLESVMSIEAARNKPLTA